MVETLSDDMKTLAAGYVLGDLDSEETRQFEQQLRENTTLQAEVSSLQTTLALLPQALPQQAPPTHLRQKILSAYSATTPIVVPRPSIPWSKIIAGIAILVALIFGSENWRLRQAFVAQQQELDATQAKLNAQQEELDTVAGIMQRSKSRLVAIEPEEINPENTTNSTAGTLLFTPGQWQKVVVSIQNLPPLPPEQIYRMWLVLENEDILPCGEFNSNDRGQVFVQLNPSKLPPKGVKATGIFVTIDSPSDPLEPEGQRILSGTI
jgi:cell division protein FtsB